MTKKFNYKLPSMVAVTLLGTAFTAHHADAAETAQDQTKNKNVLDDQATLKQANNAKQEVSNPTQNISGTQTYQDPTKVKPVKTTSTENNDTSINQQKTENTSTNENTIVKAQTTDASNQNNNQIKENSTVEETQKQEESNQALDNNEKQQSSQQNSTEESKQEVAQQNAKQETQTAQEETSETTTQNQAQQQTNTTNQNAKQTVKNNGGYRLDDDEDDIDDEANSVEPSQKTQATQQSKENVATSSNTKTQSATPKANELKANNVVNESAKVSSTQSNDNATKENAKQVTTFNSVAKPRMMYATANRATSSLPKYQPQVKSSINDYIRKKNFKAPQIEEDYSSYFPKYGYRNGVGLPEGIVVHDTANENSTITGEINYMKNNYNSAFVHAFVDGNRIIETAPTDYLSWGAGPNANNRFINVEIVHTHDYDSFARSMNNYADYAATQLQYYGLKPNSAENDGSGTVWTHAAISRWLGGTDHADPHGYLQQHNYSYNELYDLINEKYKIKMGQVAPWGTTTTTKPSTGGTTTKPSTGGSTTKPSTNDKLTVAANSGMAQIKPTNNGLYTTVYAKKGHSTNQAQKALSVTKTATLGNNKFYLVQDYNTGEKFGWVKQGDVVYNTAKSPVKVNQSYNVKPGTKAYTVPWGTDKQVAGTVSGKGNQTFKATKQQQIDKAIYLYGSVNGVNGWISKSFLTTPSTSNTTKPTTPSKPATNSQLTVAANNGVAQIKTSNSGVYTTVYDKTGKSTDQVQKTLAVSKTATLGNDKFYLVQDYNTGKKYGWVKQSDVTYNTAKSPISVNKSYNVKPGTKAYTVPWGTFKQEAGTVSGKANQTFKATKQQQIDKATYLYGTVNGISGWISKYYLTEPTATRTALAQPKMAIKSNDTTNNEAAKAQSPTNVNTTQATKQIGQVKANNTGIRSSVYDKTAKSGTKYADRTFTISKQRNEGDQTYVLLQNTASNTPLGWVNINDVDVQNLGNEAKLTGQYKVNNNNNGLYSIAWGTKNQQLLPASQLANQTFNASKAVYVGKEKYLYGTVNNRTGWIAAKDLEQANSNNPATPYNYTFVIKNNNGLYYDEPSAKNGYSLKTYFEKPFVVIKQKQQNGVTWYYGKLTNGKYVWIKESDLTKELVKYSNTGRTLNQMASIQNNLSYGPQVQRTPGVWSNATFSETKNAMDSNKLAKDPVSKYQFLRLDQPQYLSEATLNKLLKGKGVLENQGAAFSQAAKQYGLNEIYLISHALLETGNGQSQLAKGANITNGAVNTRSATKYHNVFGIAAYDYNALGEGVKFAKASGWDSVSKAIIGGAKFIGNSYVKAGQNTLYKMRWNPENPGTHQYATDINWADSNAQVLKGLYDQIGEVGKFFDIPKFKA